MGYLHPAAGAQREAQAYALGPFAINGAPADSVNEVQLVAKDEGTATGGTFTLTYDGEETAPIDWDATAAEVDAALEALPNIGAGDVTCTGGPLPGTAVTVTFTAGLSGTNVDAMTVDDSLLTIPTPAVAVVETTPGDTGVNEVQTISITGTPDGGTFTLTYDDQTTTALDFDSTAAEIDTALEALSNIGAGDVTCAGGPLPGTPVTVTFTGALAETDVVMLVADDALLTRTTPTMQVTTDTAGVLGSGQDAYPPGALLVDYVNAELYINTGTEAAPAWTLVGSQN
jgi:hypothetical protein